MVDVREKIKTAIKNKGMKQKAVAEQVGLSPQQLYDVLCKRRKLNTDEFLAICKLLEISPEKFI